MYRQEIHIKYATYTKNDRMIFLNKPITLGCFTINDSIHIEGQDLKDLFLDNNGEAMYQSTPMYLDCEDIGTGG